MKGKLIAVSGPSGVGKGTIVKPLITRREDVVASVSCTTRAPRPGEIDGKHYFFISNEEFDRRIAENDFLEYNAHFEKRYGTPKSFVEKSLQSKHVILEIEVDGALKAKASMPECILGMIVPPSVEELRARLTKRNTEGKDDIEKRLSRLDYEVSKKDLYDYVIVNDDLETAIAELSAIIDK